jgi:transcriptional regulator with XRE-family HTH domain
MNITPLADFLSNQIGDDKRFANNTEMARAVGLSEGTIRRLLDGKEPSNPTLKKLANGLRYPLADLQRMAGILADDKQVQDDITAYINEGLTRLPESDRRTVQALVDRLLKERQKKK